MYKTGKIARLPRQNSVTKERREKKYKTFHKRQALKRKHERGRIFLKVDNTCNLTDELPLLRYDFEDEFVCYIQH